MKKNLMKRFALVLIGASLLLGAAVSALADAQDFTIVNKTGMTIMSFYAAPVKNREWGSDILGEGQLENGQRANIKFSGYGENVCHFDVMMKDENEKEWIVEDIDLCETHKLTFSKQGGGVHWSAE
jgi:hypothetical protein